jgi:hypothetical protein
VCKHNGDNVYIYGLRVTALVSDILIE